MGLVHRVIRNRSPPQRIEQLIGRHHPALAGGKVHQHLHDPGFDPAFRTVRDDQIRVRVNPAAADAYRISVGTHILHTVESNVPYNPSGISSMASMRGITGG
jgi:hypothetical protein